jgi:hypothetical protein
MTLSTFREKLARRFLLPWETINPREDESPTRESPLQRKWFLESPPGDWEIEPGPSKVRESSSADDPDDLSRFLDAGVEEEISESGESRWGVWTLAMLCVGLGMIAACILVPEADASRRLVYDRDKLQLDLNQVREQVAANSDFLNKLESDPQLTQRLAEREMRSVPAGQAVVDPKPDVGFSTVESAAQRMSPFMIVNVPPPPPLAPYQPLGGAIAEVCRNSRSQTFLLGAGMFLVAAGLVLGDSSKSVSD